MFVLFDSENKVLNEQLHDSILIKVDYDQRYDQRRLVVLIDRNGYLKFTNKVIGNILDEYLKNFEKKEGKNETVVRIKSGFEVDKEELEEIRDSFNNPILVYYD